MEGQTIAINKGGPSYENPPVSEVVCGLQFDDLQGWGTANFGEFWSVIRPDYPTAEDHPPLMRTVTKGPLGFEPQFSLLPPLRRVFFIDPTANFLMQVQSSRFLYNWRKVGDSDVYPRFDAVYGRFVAAWEKFVSFLGDAHFGAPRVEMYELTYINHIFDEGARFPRDIWDFLGFYEKSPSAITAMDASGMLMQFTWPLVGESGSLTLDVKHGKRASDGHDVLWVELTARGGVGAEIRDMGDWFGLAHDAIVNTFDKFTTEKGHALWRKRI